MKAPHKQLKITFSTPLHDLIQKRAEQLGVSMASYLRMLAVNDLKDGGDIFPEEIGSQKAKKTVAQTPQVIVVNTGSGSRHDENNRSGRNGKNSNEAQSSTRASKKTVSLQDVLKMI